MSSEGDLRTRFLTNLAKFPLMERYLGPSLEERLETNNWYENRVIKYVIQSVRWNERLEQTFKEGRIDEIANAEEIFGALRGTDPEYDNKLFDALAEVRLARWARQSGYGDIEKLQVPLEQGRKTPEFRMARNEEVVLAEAKNFRPRDYFIDFVEDRLEGLALIGNRLTDFGLVVDTVTGYDEKRGEFTRSNAETRMTLLQKAREDMTVQLLSEVEAELDKGGDVESKFEVLGMPFIARCGCIPGRVTTMQTFCQNPEKTVRGFVLPRLSEELMRKLAQVKEYMSWSGEKAQRVVIFFSGASDEELEWSSLRQVLCERPDLWQPDGWAWKCLGDLRQDANRLMRIPFDLVVRTGTSLEYGLFPWEPEKRNSESA